MTAFLRNQRETGKRSDLAYDSIKEKLISGVLRGGDRLDIPALVEEIGTSRQPVIAAINRLAAENYLRVVPQVGCWVTSVERDEVEDFFRVFALTEGLACELGAMRYGAAQLEALRNNLAATLRLLAPNVDSSRQAKEFFRLNREFHGLIHDMAHSDYVAAHAGSMWDRCDFYLASADPHIQAERIAESEAEHEAIVQAVSDRDAKLAGSLMVAHIESFGHAAVRRLTKA